MTFDVGALGAAFLGLIGVIYTARVHKEIKSPNGTKTGEAVYSLKQDVATVRKDLEKVNKKVGVYGNMLVAHENRLDKLERV